MKTKIIPVQWVAVLVLAFLLCSGLSHCRHNGGANVAVEVPDPSDNCKLVKSSDYGLYNCEKGNCTGPCVLQIKNSGKKWRDIPGGNVNPSDLKSDDSIRCSCDTTKKTSSPISSAVKKD